eukprot:8138679-Karenia_brevis.AAC.1
MPEFALVPEDHVAHGPPGAVTTEPPSVPAVIADAAEAEQAPPRKRRRQRKTPAAVPGPLPVPGSADDLRVPLPPRNGKDQSPV